MEDSIAVTPVQVSVQDMIENVRVEMSSDTASLLLLDETRAVLEPAASAGLGRRWRGAPHVRVGTGFAGTVAARQSPVVVEEVTKENVINPILREGGVRRLLGVPVFGADGLVGVLHVGTFTERDFSGDDTVQLEGIAEEIGRRLSERTADDAHLAALTLQRSLLPAAPPLIDGLDIAVRYLPADGDLGGDWYDIFPLPNGKVGIVMGDVEGHGLGPAVVMGRLRSALRAYALDHDDPAEVVARLDRKLCYFENEITATVVYGVTEPPFDTIRICNAGHPAPLVSHEGQEYAELAKVSEGLLLGVHPEVARTSDEIDLAPGTALAFFTDGLVERRVGRALEVDPYSEHLDIACSVFGADVDAETACSRIIAAVLGDEPNEDDVALVVVRRPR
ncbi:diguanylate phosphodiesterase [Nocardioides silvaticus]|uniref:Diguanylate phosphodiesterase n=2 Tax=Nocardioides silvaticus TaxID=2201891 RepID=A0A316TJN6_9ACTN|nr:diguanylate phosphodiesterase [Nocardioides silvaticus]